MRIFLKQAMQIKSHACSWTLWGIDFEELQMPKAVGNGCMHIVLEGPSGSGKTAVCQALSEAIRNHGLRSMQVREFSESTSGIRLADLSRFPSSHRIDCSSTSDIFLYLADKLLQYEQAEARRASFDILISDRTFITQLVFGVNGTDSELNDLVRQTVRQLMQWLYGSAQLPPKLFVLEDSLETLVARLESRYGRPLSAENILNLKGQVVAYGAISSKFLKKYGAISIPTDHLSIPAIVARILTCIDLV